VLREPSRDVDGLADIHLAGRSIHESVDSDRQRRFLSASALACARREYSSSMSMNSCMSASWSKSYFVWRSSREQSGGSLPMGLQMYGSMFAGTIGSTPPEPRRGANPSGRRWKNR
jgi:hypothetical protein